MARRVPPDREPRAPATNPAANPDLFGEDLVPLAWEALGIGLAAYGNDKLVSPVARQVIPVANAEGKMIDALTTAATGWAAGEVAAMVSRPVANRIRRGGVLLGVAKAISAFVPGFSLSATLPVIPWLPTTTATVNSNGSAKAAVTPAVNGTATLARIGVGSMGL